MKSLNLLWTVIICMSVTLVYGQQNKGKMQLQGTVSADIKAVRVFIYDFKHLDSATVNDGHFSLEKELVHPQAGLLYLDYTGKPFRQASARSVAFFYLEPGLVNISISQQGIHVKGGKANDEQQQFQALTTPIESELSDLDDAQKYTSAADIPALKARRGALYDKAGEVAIQFAATHPESFVALEKLLYVINSNNQIEKLAQAEKVFEKLSPTVKNSDNGTEFLSTLKGLKVTAVGVTAPDFSNADTLGRQVSLHQMRGKYVLIDFWASWCGPCRAENPNVVKAYYRYRNKPFTVLGVSLDVVANRAKWLEAIHKDGLPYQQVNDPKGVTAKLYHVQSIPRNFLIDPQGKIIAKDLRGDALLEALDTFIK